MARGKIGILSQGANSSQLHNWQITDKHTTRWRQNRGSRFTVTQHTQTRSEGNESSRTIRDLGQYTSKIKVALVLERATPRAHTHLIHRLHASAAYTLAPGACTHTRTPSTHFLHFVHLSYTWLHTLRICKANWFCKLSKQKMQRTFKRNQNDIRPHILSHER